MKRCIGQNLGGNAELPSPCLMEGTHGVINLR